MNGFGSFTLKDGSTIDGEFRDDIKL